MYRPGGACGGMVRSFARCLMPRSACRYAWVDLMDSCPSQSEMVAMSIPAASIRIAVLCRSTWGVTVFVAREGQTVAAVAAWTRRRWARASVLIGLSAPWVLNTAVAVAAARFSFCQACRAVLVSGFNGVIRSLRPLPWHLAWAGRES